MTGVVPRVAVVAGGSGLVGGQLVGALLAHADVARVVCLGRRPLARPSSEPGAHKLEQRVVDFAKLSADDIPKDVDDAYCALGTTMKQAGSKEAFLAVDRDAVLAFAKAARAQGARRLLLVSALSADPRAAVFYSRVKGEVEQATRNLGYDTVHILRPSVLAGAREKDRPGERVGVAATRLLSRVLGGTQWKYAPIGGDVVARAMVQLAFADARGVHVHDSPALHRLGT
jgi:uncharacterized protein YbjT (DUF2867 family)